MNKTQLKFCKSIHLNLGLNQNTVQNIWATFLLKSIKLLDENGILAFILPSDLLQVNFAKEIRDYLISIFDKLEIFTFNKLLFENIGQDTILIFCFKNSVTKGVYYTQIENIQSLNSDKYTLKANHSLISYNTKWTHHSLTDEEISFLMNLKSKLNLVKAYCISSPGIVTAANNYFIINKDLEEQYKLHAFTKKIIQKGNYVNGKIEFDAEDLHQLENNNIPTRILCFSDNIPFQQKNKEYLEIGKELEIHKRYKCSLRPTWYMIPNIGTPPVAFFFKRCNKYPKLILNSANVLITDSAYKIDIINGYDIFSLIYSFYNSLTLAFAEIEGRYYGDGVLELTPAEFKKLPIPYTQRSEEEFNTFKHVFANKKNIEEILELTDKELLLNKLNISIEDVKLVQNIRKKLLQKRLKKL